MEEALKLVNISKHFNEVFANKCINLTLYKGEILAILGENGSGKTTLMNIIDGIYKPDEGEIYVNGEKALIKSPADAYSLGIGMVHQHFKLIETFSAFENIILGDSNHPKTRLKEKRKIIDSIIKTYGFMIDIDKKIMNMAVSEKQTVEIIKVLYKDAEILILDEPTAVLTPQETDIFFKVLRVMKERGKSVIIITHKLNEVRTLCTDYVVLRNGRMVAEGSMDDADVVQS